MIFNARHMVRREARCIVEHEPHGVAQPRVRLGMHDAIVRQPEQPGSQHHQITGEVSAIDGRHIVRCERLERLRVVPVVEMP